MRFHLVHIQIDGGHGLLGYREVIDTVGWGLTQLGYTVTYGVNEIEPRARNIVFGVQMIPAARQAEFPDDTIVYNFEQFRGAPVEAVRPEVRSAAARFRVWDYTDQNMDVWRQLPLAFDPVVVPVAYAPVLERIPRPPVQDIDVLMYGLPNEIRLAAYHALAKTGMTTVFVCGLYGAARDELIGRSKAVLNVTLYKSRIFEIVRTSYLWANRKAVIAMLDADSVADAESLQWIVASDRKMLQRDAVDLVQNDDERAALEERAYEGFRKRDIRPILAAALEASC